VSSTLDLETVLTTIVGRTAELAGTEGGAIYEYDDAAEQFRLRAEQGLAGGLVPARREIGIRKGEGAVGLLAVTREPVQIADIAQEGSYQSRSGEFSLVRASGAFSLCRSCGRTA
jgi:signal transduction protein with GAF and PtsI domain